MVTTDCENPSQRIIPIADFNDRFRLAGDDYRTRDMGEGKEAVPNTHERGFIQRKVYVLWDKASESNGKRRRAIYSGRSRSPVLKNLPEGVSTRLLRVVRTGEDMVVIRRRNGQRPLRRMR